MRCIFQRHSTLFGIVSAVLAALLTALLTRSWVVACLAGVLTLTLAPRFFYGRKESRALDRDRVTPGSLGIGPWQATGTEFRTRSLSRAYYNAKPGGGLRFSGLPPDDSELRALVEEDQ